VTRHLLVLGGGAAGLSAAIVAAEAGLEVTLADAADLASSASIQAQGGLAAVTPLGVSAGSLPW
jgi:L-aspartate oxidase